MPDKSPYIRLLGKPTVTVSGGQVNLPHKAIALIIRLSAQGGKPLSRSVISRELWPSVGRRSALHSLSQGLYTIKKKLGPAALSADHDSVGLGEIGADVIDFIDATSIRDWSAAADLYQGEFAEGFSVESAVAFSHWLDVQRERLARLATETAIQLESRHALQQAAAITGLLMSSGRYNSELIRLHTRILATTEGKGAGQSFATSLPKEWAVEATDALEQLSTDPLGESHEFVGRDVELGWLADEYRKALGGPPRMVLLEGEPGIGKTRLINRFCRISAIRGAKVLQASAYESEHNVPWGVVGQWLQDLSVRDWELFENEPWLRTLEKVFPSLRPEWPEREQSLSPIGHQRLLESLRRLLTHIAESRPLLAIIDDIQFSDAASLSFLHYFMRRTDRKQILILAGVRAGQDHVVDPVRSWNAARVLELGGLSLSETAELIADIREERRTYSEHVDVQSLWNLSGGNPLLISTLVQEDQPTTGQERHPPETILEFFRPRLESRSSEALSLLVALAISGEGATSDQLTDISGRSFHDVEGALAELTEANLIRTHEEGWSLSHGLVGEVALSLCSAVEKQRLYGRAARQAARSGVSVFSEAAVSHDIAGNREDAFEASLRASGACDVLNARSEKEFFLKLALANAPSPTAEAAVRMELANLHLQQGKPKQAVDVLNLPGLAEVPAEHRDRMELIRLRALAAMAGDGMALQAAWLEMRSLGKIPRLEATDGYAEIAKVAYDLGLEEVANEAAKEIEKSLADLPLSAEAARWLLVPTMVTGLLDGFAAGLDKVELLPKPDESEPSYLTPYWATMGSLLIQAGRLKEAEELFARSLGLVERYALFDEYYPVNNNLGVCLMEQGRLEEARRHFDAAIEYAKAETSPSHHATGRDNLTILAYEAGEYEEATQLGSRLLVADGPTSGVRMVMSLHAIVGLSCLELGRLRQCREAERELQILLDRHGPLSNDLSYVHTFLARMRSLRGEEDEAVAALGRAAAFYEGRNVLAKLRIELERFRILTRIGVDCRDGLRTLLQTAMPTGARPLVVRIQAQLERG